MDTMLADEVFIVGKPGKYQVTNDGKPRYKRPAEIARWRKHIVADIGGETVRTLCDRFYHIDDCHVVPKSGPNPMCAYCMHQLIPNPVFAKNMKIARENRGAKGDLIKA